MDWLLKNVYSHSQKDVETHHLDHFCVFEHLYMFLNEMFSWKTKNGFSHLCYFKSMIPWHCSSDMDYCSSSMFLIVFPFSKPDIFPVCVGIKQQEHVAIVAYLLKLLATHNCRQFSACECTFKTYFLTPILYIFYEHYTPFSYIESMDIPIKVNSSLLCIKRGKK